MKSILLLCACSAFMSQADARAKEFSILLYETPATLAQRDAPDQSARYWDSYNQVATAMTQAGVLRGGTALGFKGSETVRGAGTPGGLAFLAGYFVIEVPDLAAARLWAQKMPASAVTVDIKAHRQNPTMAAK